jgi:predicted Zn finger-like uncharacterized protein
VIVACPACQTRYLVEESELGGEAGRRVRCASCGHLWHYSAEAAAIHLAVAAITAELTAAQAGASPAAPTLGGSTAPPAPALRAEPGTQAQPFSAAAAAPVRPAVAPVPYVPPQRRQPGGPWLAALALVAALVMIVVLGRDNLVALYPPIAELYRALHIPLPASTGLRITSSVTREADRLTVAGDIVNTSQQPQPLTRLRVTLFDGERRSLETRLIAPPIALLPPGLTAYYSTTFERPSITVAGADVTFASE